MSSEVDYKEEYNKTYDQLEEFLKLLEDPKKYRKAFQESFEKEIFDVLKDELIEYMRSNQDFRQDVLSKFQTESGPRVRNPFNTPPRSSITRTSMIYNPRSSSRPSLD